MSTVSELFKNLSSPEMLAKIAKEIKDTTKEVKVKRKGVIHTETRRGKSEIVLNAIHEFMGDEHLEGCANAEFPCLFALVKVFLDEKNGGAIIDGLAKILPILYSKPNVLAAHFSQINVYIQKNFVDSKVAMHAQEKLHLSKEAAILRQTDYAAKVYKQHGEQKQLVDSEILEKINELRTHEDWQSLLVCIGLAIGSRLIEIITVSNYLPAENPIYCIIEGVAKDKHDKEGGPDEDEEEKEPANKRRLTKPIIGGIVYQELNQLVQKVRGQLHVQYNMDLNGFPGGRKLTRRQITNLVNKQANDKMREIFGEGYSFHDCRGIYAQMAWIMFAPPSMSQSYYYSQILGHAENSLTTSLSYIKFSIRRKLKEDDPDLVGKITTLEAEFHEFKKLEHAEKKQKVGEEENVENVVRNKIYFQDQKGQIFSIEKQPHVRDGDQEARTHRLRQVIAVLEERGVNPTYRILSKIGFGSDTIRNVKKNL